MNVDSTTEHGGSLQQAYGLALVGLPLLLIYGAAQASLSFALAPHEHALKLVIEPHLLLIGLILHVQWRKVGSIFRDLGLTRPRWIAAADCASFVTTFWALTILGEAFLREAKVI